MKTVVLGLVRAAAVMMGLAAAACSSDSGSAPAVFTGPGSGTGGSSTCTPDEPCTCSSGNTGKLTCEGNRAVCACAPCPEYKDTPSSWTACGGEPFGRWRAVSTVIEKATLQIDRDDGLSKTLLGTCPGEVRQQPPDLRMVIELRDGGAAKLSMGALNFSFAVKESCVRSYSSNGCSDLKVSGGSCSSEACGNCACEVTGGLAEGDGGWSRNGNTLRLTTDLFLIEVDYCVSGDQLTLHDPSGVLITMERAHVSGQPTSCGSRAPEECKLGGGCGVGSCVGGSKCGGAHTSSACGTLQGCSWDSTSCVGAPPSSCALADYGVVPGCVFIEGSAQCVGTTTPCTSQGSTCELTPGCKAGDGCVGGVTPCSQYSHSCTDCGGLIGCGCDGNGDCVGAATCEGQSVFRCDNLDGCKWAHCQGQATPCQDIPELTCETTPGCHVEITPTASGGSGGSGGSGNTAGSGGNGQGDNGGAAGDTGGISMPACGHLISTTTACAACLDANCCPQTTACDEDAICFGCFGFELSACKGRPAWETMKACKNAHCAGNCP